MILTDYRMGDLRELDPEEGLVTFSILTYERIWITGGVIMRTIFNTAGEIVCVVQVDLDGECGLAVHNKRIDDNMKFCVLVFHALATIAKELNLSTLYSGVHDNARNIKFITRAGFKLVDDDPYFVEEGLKTYSLDLTEWETNRDEFSKESS